VTAGFFLDYHQLSAYFQRSLKHTPHNGFTKGRVILKYAKRLKVEQMFRKRLTFVVVPDSSQASCQLSVKLWMLYAGLAAAVLLVFASFFLASNYFSGQVSEAELDRLRAENNDLAGKYEELRWSLAQVRGRYDDLVQKEVALRSVFGLPEISTDERQLGIGGPEPMALARLSETQRLAYSTESEVDRLLLLSEFEIEKFAEAESALTDLKDRLDHTPSIWPADGWMSRGYGMKHDPFTGYKQFHRGIDLANNRGTPIVASADGKIREVGTFGRLGKMVIVDHGYGFVTRYGHLSQIDVKRGQSVKRGDIIGLMGSTGYSTGPHLHYEVWRNGKVMNPADFILNDKETY